ncbi:MAG: ABC transporter ATP-binding protein [Spirochaetota bacterium]
MAAEKILELRNLTKRFGEVVAVNNLNIPFINRGEFVTFLGPSGCGKTTLLRMIAGFYYPTLGDIIMHGERINDIPPEKRKTSMVFQNYALFPHMSVYDNIAYGLKIRKLSKDEIRQRVSRILNVVQLDGLEHRRPSELSGGQQQRVALARCIVIEPEIILLDEPLSNLDASLRVMMREEIRKIQQSLNLTVIFVTHDQEEAMTMSDRIVVMNRGEVEQIGTPREIYETPGSLFVACFIGYINLIEGRVIEKQDKTYKIQTSIGEFINVNESLEGISKGDSITMIIRPEAASIEDSVLSEVGKTTGKVGVKAHREITDETMGKTTGKTPGKNCFRGRVESLTYIGSLLRYRVRCEGFKNPFIVDVSNPGGKLIRNINEEVTVRIPDKFHCIKS